MKRLTRTLLMCLLGSCIISLATAQEYVLRLANVVAPTEPVNIVAEQLAQRVAERTNGRVRIEIFPASQLGGGRDYLEQAALGAPVIGHTDPGYVSTEYGVPELAVLAGPFLIQGPEEIPALIESEMVQEWNDRLAENGLRVLSWNWYFGDRHIISDAGYPAPADIAGVKIRVPPNPVWTETFEALDTVGVTLEWAEVYNGLQQGVVDAAEAPLSTLYGSRLYEVADTITLTGHFIAITGMVMGEEYWQTLPEDIQQILLEEFARGGTEMSRMTIDSQVEFRQLLEAEGVTFVEPDTDAYAEATSVFYSNFPGFPEGIYDTIQSILGR